MGLVVGAGDGVPCAHLRGLMQRSGCVEESSVAAWLGALSIVIAISPMNDNTFHGHRDDPCS